MNSSGTQPKQNNINILKFFLYPCQKDIFDFPHYQETEELENMNKPSIDFNSNKRTRKQKEDSWIGKDIITEQKSQEEISNSRRSNLTFATRCLQQHSSKIKSEKIKDKLLRGKNNQNSKKILNQQQQDMLLTSKHKSRRQQDFFSNIFLKQVTKTQAMQKIQADQQKRRLFENINSKENGQKQSNINYFSNSLILKTLYDIKEINQQNLFVNKKILSEIIHQNQKKTKKILKATGNFLKSDHKKNYSQINRHLTSTKGFSQNKNQFYLYEKPVKISTNNKLSQGKIQNKKNATSLTNQTNLTKLWLNQNTTKLSLGDKSLGSHKIYHHDQSKSTIKKMKVNKKLSNLQLEDHIEQKLSEINKIKDSLKIGIKKGHSGLQMNYRKSTNKKKSRSQLMVRC